MNSKINVTAVLFLIVSLALILGSFALFANGRGWLGGGSLWAGACMFVLLFNHGAHKLNKA